MFKNILYLSQFFCPILYKKIYKNCIYVMSGGQDQQCQQQLMELSEQTSVQAWE